MPLDQDTSSKTSAGHARSRVHRAQRARNAALVASVAGFVGIVGGLASNAVASSSPAASPVVVAGHDDGESSYAGRVIAGDDDWESDDVRSTTPGAYGSAVPSSTASSAGTRTVTRGS